MSLTLINRSGRQELKLEAFTRERNRRRSRPCNDCGKQVFNKRYTTVEHHYCIEHLAVPWTDVVLNITIHNCQGDDEDED